MAERCVRGPDDKQAKWAGGQERAAHKPELNDTERREPNEEGVNTGQGQGGRMRGTGRDPWPARKRDDGAHGRSAKRQEGQMSADGGSGVGAGQAERAGGGAGAGTRGGRGASAADRPPTDGPTGLLPDSGQNHRALRARAARERPPANRDLGKRAPGCAASARTSVKRIVFGQLLRMARRDGFGAPSIAATVAMERPADAPRLGTRRPPTQSAPTPGAPAAHRPPPAAQPALPYLNRLSSSELHTTDTLERAMAAPASAGARMPTAASGIMMQL